MDEQQARAMWNQLTHRVTDLMKVHTRPFVPALAGSEIGTGTFIERNEIEVLTCAHVASCAPDAHYIDDSDTILNVGTWRTDQNPAVDAAIAPIPSGEWAKVAGRAMPLAMRRFASNHRTVAHELLFFRGLAGENTAYIGTFGAEAIVSGYCSQEKPGSGDANIFEMHWEPGAATVTMGTGLEAGSKVKYDHPAGFSGSLVWNTRFVEMGCDLAKWTPDDAMITGLLRRYDPGTKTLLAWRVEHLLAWL
ncbi:hypothetical protein JQ594_21660 [Bradyrhizobium manausense]|uniref:hypothetical protein n=1 Tax=Bradyrhizobium manausense TaxID=989370 RepID=UPI001BAB50C9|nr:hypothetical protein [Bradyrhizobium manausense]MBR0688548.1 hypothetical protein [Bradyrhizobium manausense]